MLTEQMIAEYQGGHRLDHRHGSWQDARIVTPPRSQLSGLALHGDSLLRLGNGGGRLEGDAKLDVLPVAVAALNATGTVRVSPDLSLLDYEGIIVLVARKAGSGKAAADLEPLGGR